METLFIVGRVLFAGFFLYYAYKHLVEHKYLAGYAAMKGVPMPTVSVVLTGLVLLFGGASILFAWNMAYGLSALLVFLVPTTLTMHQFWKETDPTMKANEQIAFLKNMALIGATIMMFALPGVL